MCLCLFQYSYSGYCADCLSVLWRWDLLHQLPLTLWAFGIPPKKSVLLSMKAPYVGSTDCCTLPTTVCVLRCPYTSTRAAGALCTCRAVRGKGLLRVERPTKEHMVSRWREEHCWVYVHTCDVYLRLEQQGINVYDSPRIGPQRRKRLP